MSKPHEQDRLVLGTWSQVASAEVVDMVGLNGFEFTIVDIEHGFFGLETAENLFRACAAVGLEPWIRVPNLDPALIGKALDSGARAVVVPGIASAQDAETAVRATRFGPQGLRGACPCVRAGGHFIRDWKGYVGREEGGTGAVLLVETREGLEAFDEIAEVPDVRAFLVGPFDLSVSLGHEGDYLHAEVQEGVQFMVRRAMEAGIPVVVPVFSPDLDEARRQLGGWYARGVRRFVVGTDKILISDQFARYSGALRALEATA